jgi:hypothetical protein
LVRRLPFAVLLAMVWMSSITVTLGAPGIFASSTGSPRALRRKAASVAVVRE